tara:strand:- start:11660 stop:12058 length:399 start_codon:yes stop_codon:yes gene_type:complete
MSIKIIQKKLILLGKTFKNYFHRKNNLSEGIIFTLYSDKLNLLEVGYTPNNQSLNKILLGNKYILLDKKVGNLFQLKLLKNTLNQLSIKLLDDRYYEYTNTTIRYLNILGWPIGNSLYKRRRIKKEIAYSTI